MRIKPRAQPFALCATRVMWRFEDSLFASYRREHTRMYTAAATNDWDRTKVCWGVLMARVHMCVCVHATNATCVAQLQVAGFIPDQSEATKLMKVTERHFDTLQGLFRYYCCTGTTNDVRTVSWSSFTQFCTDAKLADEAECRRAVRGGQDRTALRLDSVASTHTNASCWPAGSGHNIYCLSLQGLCCRPQEEGLAHINAAIVCGGRHSSVGRQVPQVQLATHQNR